MNKPNVRTPAFAKILSIVLVAVSFFLGFFMSVNKIEKQAEDILLNGYEGKSGSIYERLHQKANETYNFGRLSEKQPILNQTYVTTLFEEAKNVLESKNIGEAFEANIRLTAIEEALYLEYKQLDEKDEARIEATEMIQGLRALEDRIQNDGAIYNQWAANKNKELRAFPANLFMNIFNKNYLALYEPAK